jgi:hypothetical protein
VLIPGAYQHASALGGELADGIEQAIGEAGLPWTVIRFAPRSGQWYGPMPRTGAEAHALTDDLLTRLVRVWLANRGIWEALSGGPDRARPRHPRGRGALRQFLRRAAGRAALASPPTVGIEVHPAARAARRTVRKKPVTNWPSQFLDAQKCTGRDALAVADGNARSRP